MVPVFETNIYNNLDTDLLHRYIPLKINQTILHTKEATKIEKRYIIHYILSDSN